MKKVALVLVVFAAVVAKAQSAECGCTECHCKEKVAALTARVEALEQADREKRERVAKAREQAKARNAEKAAQKAALGGETLTGIQVVKRNNEARKRKGGK